VAYQNSVALRSWLGDRAESITRVADAHAAMGEVEGPGRPLELGRPLAHAYIIRLVAEFQGFVRDLYDLAAEHLVTSAEPPDGLVTILTTAITRGRAIDAGNATMTALRTDFRRLGIRNLEGKLAARYQNWDKDHGGTDPARYNALVGLRNALAHGNQRQVDEHRRQGHPDTVTWGRQQVPVLNRAARGLDRIVWDHLAAETGASPW
jgi:hypothetical protein